jgi:uncharacterized SAM-binding protein YcdF (DUF218 family)
MLIDDDQLEDDQPAPPLAAPRNRRRHVVLGALLFIGTLFIALTARLFVWPDSGVPAHADAIIVFSGAGDRLSVGYALASRGVAPNLVISVGSPEQAENDRCNRPMAGVTVSCFVPHPGTTQGEARYAAQLANTNHWQSLILVTSTPQDWRARLRTGRCYSGKIYVATAPLPRHEWPWAVVYEWGATLKALLLQ